MNKFRIFYWIGMVICIAAFIGAAIYMGSYFWAGHNNQEEINDLRQIAYFSDEQNSDQTGSASSSNATKSNKSKKQDVINFKKLQKINPDIKAWLCIVGTKVDHPVMYTPDNEQEYIHKDVYNNDNARGTLFFSKESKLFDDESNLMIYGHHMKDGSMFGDLMNYKSPDYGRKNHIVYLFTEKERITYDVSCVFLADVTNGRSGSYIYSKAMNWKTKEEFEEFASEVKKREAYHTDYEFTEKDELLLLSTCEYSTTNGRLVVVCTKRS